MIDELGTKKSWGAIESVFKVGQIGLIVFLGTIVFGMDTKKEKQSWPELVISQEPLGSSPGTKGRLVLWKEGQLRVLTESFEWAGQPCVSFDGESILFAGREFPGADTQIYEMGLKDNPSTPKKMTTELGGCSHPQYVGSLFHLDDQKPSAQFLFEKESTGAPATLFICGVNEGDPQPITQNLFYDGEPDVLRNGRIVYVSTRSDGSQQILAINNDGTDLMRYAQTKSQTLGCPGVGADRLYFLENLDPMESGAFDLGWVSLRRPLKSGGQVHAPNQGRFKSPCPLPDGRVLISYRRSPGDAYSLYQIQIPEGTLNGPVVQTEKWNCLGAQPVVVQPVAKGRSTVVNLKKKSGVFFCTNVFDSMDKEMTKDKIRLQDRLPLTLRVLTGNRASREERELGRVPIESDGSFHVQVPAQIPVRFEILDSKGNSVLQQKSWSWVMPNESRGCIGCHEDPERVVQNRLVKAIVKPAVKLGIEESEK